MDSVVHFEMPWKDKQRVSDFYSKVFGWNMKHMGPDMGNYLLAQTAETDDKMMVKTPGTINGGFYQQTDQTGNSTHVVISVKDIKATLEKIKAEGGTVMGEPMDIPGVGLYAMFHDSEGNKVCVLQPSKT